MFLHDYRLVCEISIVILMDDKKNDEEMCQPSPLPLIEKDEKQIVSLLSLSDATTTTYRMMSCIHYLNTIFGLVWFNPL